MNRMSARRGPGCFTILAVACRQICAQKFGSLPRGAARSKDERCGGEGL